MPWFSDRNKPSQLLHQVRFPHFGYKCHILLARSGRKIQTLSWTNVVAIRSPRHPRRNCFGFNTAFLQVLIAKMSRNIQPSHSRGGKREDKDGGEMPALHLCTLVFLNRIGRCAGICSCVEESTLFCFLYFTKIWNVSRLLLLLSNYSAPL